MFVHYLHLHVRVYNTCRSVVRGVLISEGIMYRLQWSLGPEDVSLLERCPYFRGYYVQASMEFGT